MKVLLKCKQLVEDARCQMLSERASPKMQDKNQLCFFSPWQAGAHITWYSKIAQPNGGYVRGKKIFKF